MAHSITVTKIIPGTYRTVFLVSLVSDGASGELADEVIVSPSDLGLPSSARLAIETIEYNFSGFDCWVEFDSGAVDDNLMWVLSRENSIHDFNPYGGIKDPSDPDGTGKIQLNTSGFGSAGSIGSILIKVRNA